MLVFWYSAAGKGSILYMIWKLMKVWYFFQTGLMLPKQCSDSRIPFVMAPERTTPTLAKWGRMMPGNKFDACTLWSFLPAPFISFLFPELGAMFVFVLLWINFHHQANQKEIKDVLTRFIPRWCNVFFGTQVFSSTASDARELYSSEAGLIRHWFWQNRPGSQFQPRANLLLSVCAITGDVSELWVRDSVLVVLVMWLRCGC